MATASYAVSTGSSDLSGLWRKIQAGIVVAAQFGVEEWNALQDLEKFNVDWSSREITFELDINDDAGVAFIPEGGKEGRPSSPNTVTAQVTWVFANKRFTVSKTSQYIAQRTPKGQLGDQLKYQAKKAVQAVRGRIGDGYYGLSTGTLGVLGAVAGAPTYTLKDMYGVVGLGLAGANRVAAALLHENDFVAALNPVGPALRSIQKVTAAPDLVNNQITTDAAFAGGAIGDLLVMANNLENTTIAGGTERNLALIGLLDAMTSDSIHGVASSAHAKWTPFADTAGGRFDGIRLRKMKQHIANIGGGKLDTVWWANGVENDVVAQYQAGLRFSDAWSMEIDGMAKSKGVTFNTSRRVPDGHVFAYDKSKSVKKMVLLPEPGTPAFEDGHKLQDDSGTVFSFDYPCALVYTNRANMAYANGLTQS